MNLCDLNTANVVLTELFENVDHHSLSDPCTNQELLELLQPILQESQRHQRNDWAAHMSPSLAPYSLLGTQLAALHGGNLLSPELYPLLEKAEKETLSWLQSLFLQKHGHFTHGSSYGNLEALWKAREHNKTSRSTVYASTAAHYSIHKACQILNLNLVEIACDQYGRIDISDLLQQCRHTPPLAIVANMGTTSTGVIDALTDIVALAQHNQSWLHIDAAWGGALMLLPEYAESYNCVALADSISFDPHKALFQPKPCSVVFYRDHIPTVTADTSYLTRSPLNILPGSYGGELFLPLWLNLHLLGIEWFRVHVRARLTQAQRLVALIKESTDWPIIQSETGLVCFQPADYTALEPLVAQGLISSTNVNDQPFYRAVFAGHQTEADALFRALKPFL